MPKTIAKKKINNNYEAGKSEIEMASSNILKEEVLDYIANGKRWHKANGEGPAKWLVGNDIVHVRFRTNPKSNGVSFAYNINPNTLTADYEVWICGKPSTYYLIPIDIMRKIYNSPSAYVDKTHPEIRVVDINTKTHYALYGAGGKKMDFSAYYRARL